MTEEGLVEEERPAGDSSGVYLGVSADDLGYGGLQRVQEETASGRGDRRPYVWLAGAVLLATLVLWALV